MSDVTSTLSRDAVHEFVHAMTAEMATPEFSEKLREAVRKDPPPSTAAELIAVLEKLQEEFLDRRAGPTIGGGAAVLRDLRQAVLRHPDGETEAVIRRMCALQDSLMVSLCASTPALAPLLQHCEHNHSHGHHCHDHGHDHDHGHNHNHGHNHDHCHGHNHGHGHHCHGHGALDAQQVREMQMALQSLPPELQQEMTRVQQRIASGQPPTPGDVKTIQNVQAHVSAFVATLREFDGGVGAGQGGDVEDP